MKYKMFHIVFSSNLDKERKVKVTSLKCFPFNYYFYKMFVKPPKSIQQNFIS